MPSQPLAFVVRWNFAEIGVFLLAMVGRLQLIFSWKKQRRLQRQVHILNVHRLQFSCDKDDRFCIRQNLDVWLFRVFLCEFWRVDCLHTIAVTDAKMHFVFDVAQLTTPSPFGKIR
jgi:hypothetical protein